jgi:26S proteasome regulatory subunit N7
MTRLAIFFTTDMAPFYELICEEQGWSVDTELLNNMKKENEDALKKLDERLKDAEENLGETEISDTLLARAEYFAKIGDKVRIALS